MADGVNHRHNRFVEGAFYVSIGGMGSLVTSVGDDNGDAVAYTFDKTGRSGSSILKAQSRGGYTELWPVPETKPSVEFTAAGSPQDSAIKVEYLMEQSQATKDALTAVKETLGQLRRDVDGLKNPPIPWRELGTFRIDIYTTGPLHHPSATVTHKPTQLVESNDETVSANRNADLAHARIVERIATAGTCPCCHEVECDPGCPCETIRERHSE